MKSQNANSVSCHFDILTFLLDTKQQVPIRTLSKVYLFISPALNPELSFTELLYAINL